MATANQVPTTTASTGGVVGGDCFITGRDGQPSGQAAQRSEMVEQRHEPHKTPPFSLLSVQVKLTNVPSWFDGLAGIYAQSKLDAFRALQGKSVEDKTAIATFARRHINGKLPSMIADALCQEVQADWRSYKALRKNGNRFSMPKSVAAHSRFVVRDRGISVFPETKELHMKIRRRDSLWARLNFQCGEWQQRRLMAALRYGETEFFRRNGKWFANIAIRIPVSEAQLSNIGFLHCGQLRLLTAVAIEAGSRQFVGKFVDGTEYWRRRRRFRNLRQHLGKRKLMCIIKRMDGKERRWSNWYFHTLAVRLLEWMLENGVGCLVIGSHRRMRDRCGKKAHKKDAGGRFNNWRLATWGFRMFLDRLRYKAQLAGLEIWMLDEAAMRVTLRCHHCGKENTPEDKYTRTVRCQGCSKSTHVEWNAIRNLCRQAGIERIFRKPGGPQSRLAICENTEGRFDPNRLGVPDMRQRLHSHILKREK